MQIRKNTILYKQQAFILLSIFTNKKIVIVSEAMKTVDTTEMPQNWGVLTGPHELSLLEIQKYLDLLLVFVTLTDYYPGRLDHGVWDSN